MSDDQGSLLGSICIVMVEPSHPGNIGAAARAMKNMGFSQLRLVNPQGFPSVEASARASGAADVLHEAEIFETFEAAIADCHRIVATTARPRRANWVHVTPDDAASLVLKTLSETVQQSRVAIVFGRESSGLTNSEMDLCHYLSYIPTAIEYASLNVAAAIQVYTYVLYNRISMHDTSVVVERQDTSRDTLKASSADMEGMFQHLFELLSHVGFLKGPQTSTLKRRIRMLFMRAMPTHREVQIFRGIYRKILNRLN